MISVVMPAYNSAQYIAAAIESILNQTYADFELLVIDDGSTDNTLEIVKHYAAQDSRIRLIQQQNAGVGAARNNGLHAAQYAWIALLDSDDIALADRLEKQVASIKSDPEVVVWSSAVRHMGANGVISDDVKEVGPSSKAKFYELYKAGKLIYIATTAATFRKDIALELGGFDVRFKSAGDTEFWDRMASRGPMVGVTEPLVLYRVHTGGIMAKRWSELYRNTRYLEERSKLRSKGRELSFDEFLKAYDDQPPLTRFFRSTDRLSQLYYRNAGAFIGSKQYAKGLAYLSLSALLNPQLILGRVFRRLMPSASS